LVLHPFDTPTSPAKLPSQRATHQERVEVGAKERTPPGGRAPSAVDSTSARCVTAPPPILMTLGRTLMRQRKRRMRNRRRKPIGVVATAVVNIALPHSPASASSALQNTALRLSSTLSPKPKGDAVPATRRSNWL
uniref:Os01g0778700 protein n=1 Tax=Taenia asiatica TaxID=60517 RepID=A0A0R3VW98_TAEAS